MLNPSCPGEACLECPVLADRKHHDPHFRLSSHRGGKQHIKKQRDGAVRWLVKANGEVVGVEHSEEKAKRRAQIYYYRCCQQDEPCDPEMTIEKECVIDA